MKEIIIHVVVQHVYYVMSCNVVEVLIERERECVCDSEQIAIISYFVSCYSVCGSLLILF